MYSLHDCGCCVFIMLPTSVIELRLSLDRERLKAVYVNKMFIQYVCAITVVLKRFHVKDPHINILTFTIGFIDDFDVYNNTFFWRPPGTPLRTPGCCTLLTVSPLSCMLN